MIPISKPTLLGNEKDYVTQCIDTEWISSAGKFIPQFEEMNAAQYGKKHGVAVSNGTVALHLALEALGVGPGDEVIVPDLTFAATINSVLYTGATPIIADIDPISWTISLESCAQVITSQTKAIIPVHLYGQPADMDGVMRFAEANGLYVVEDCAEAHGAKINGQPIGSFGHINCFSFYGNKIITTGEGGICVTDEGELDKIMRTLRDHGMSPERKYWHDRVGYNYRMTNMQAAIGVAQMEKFDEMLETRRDIAENYRKQLAGVSHVRLQTELPGRTTVPWIYSVLIDTQAVEMDIPEIQKGLATRGVDSRPFFAPLSTMPVYEKYARTSTDSAKSISAAGLSLPTFIGLTADDIQTVCSALDQILQGGQ